MADNNAGDGVDNEHLITPLLVRGPTHFPRQQNPLTSRHIGLSPPTEYCLSWFFSHLSTMATTTHSNFVLKTKSPEIETKLHRGYRFQ